jgi:glucose-6-phosphate 1-dehydrogenase
MPKHPRVAQQDSRSTVPTVFVIFGATGDLTHRKLIPSLFSLYEAQALPKLFSIIGFSHRPITETQFQQLLWQQGGELKKKPTFKKFISCIRYHQGDFEDRASYDSLAQKLGYQDKQWKACASKLFHLAVPPKYYPSLLKHLADSGLTDPCSEDEGWTRILVEKPFGHNEASAARLDMLLGRLFKEEQIFRVDHYLAKDTVQNILAFRFSNSIFEPLWNNRYIERVHIRLLEKIDIGTRGNFYNDIGALRDVGQNHLLQMLALVSMNNPKRLVSDAIRRGRSEVMKSLHLMRGEELNRSIVRGQYQGYTRAKNVPMDSKTETYFKLKAFIDNPRWRRVPFYLESGKALAEKKTEIKVYFKPIHPCFCERPHAEHRHQNTVTFRIQPDEGISIKFYAKKSDLSGDIESRNLSFRFHRGNGKELDAYEKLLFDAIRGDQTLFASTAEVAAQWKFITPILKKWQKLPLHTYKIGSKGPMQKL